MSGRTRVRPVYLFLIALFVLAVVAIPLAILSRSYFKQKAAIARQQAAISRQQAAVDALRQRGATVVLGTTKSGLPPDVISVDLSRGAVDAELMQTLVQFTGIERLTLDGAKLQPEDWGLLGKLPRLQSLSLARSNITDASVSGLPPGLTRLSLSGTAVTDKSMSQLAAMSGLTSLDITDTEVTCDGLRLLEPLTSLETLWIAESCISAESAGSLRLMQPQNIDVTVLDGLGKETYESLSVCKGSKIRGHHRDGYLLWETDSAWSETLAGVVEAVVSEVDLDSQEAAQLLKALGTEQSPMLSWGPTAPASRPPTNPFLYSWNQPDRGIEIASVDAFIRELQKPPTRSTKTGASSNWDYPAVRRFAREKFAASDVPKLVAAMRRAQYSRDDRLFKFGPSLLVQHGIDNPEVLAELDRLLAHEEYLVRATTVCAFGYGGASHFYPREEWTASKAADAFAVPRLMRICQDKKEPEGMHYDASLVLAEIAHRRPEYVAEVLPVLVDLLDEEGSWHYSDERLLSRVDIPRLAEVAPDAALALVPTIRDMLKKLDEQLAGVPAASFANPKAPEQALRRRRLTVLEALSAIAHHDPALAHEIALEYLSRMEDGQPAGPFDTLLSPETPEANRIVVTGLLRNANVAVGELASVAKKIRDWRTAKEQVLDR